MGPASNALMTYLPFHGGRPSSQIDILPGTVVRHLPFHAPPFTFATSGHFFSASAWLQIGPASTAIVLVCAEAAEGGARQSSAAPTARVWAIEFEEIFVRIEYLPLRVEDGIGGAAELYLEYVPAIS